MERKLKNTKNNNKNEQHFLFNNDILCLWILSLSEAKAQNVAALLIVKNKHCSQRANAAFIHIYLWILFTLSKVSTGMTADWASSVRHPQKAIDFTDEFLSLSKLIPPSCRSPSVFTILMPSGRLWLTNSPGVGRSVSSEAVVLSQMWQPD